MKTKISAEQKLVGQERYSASYSHWQYGVIKVKVIAAAEYLHVRVKSLTPGIYCDSIIPTPCLHLSEAYAIDRMKEIVDMQNRIALRELEKATETLRQIERVRAAKFKPELPKTKSRKKAAKS